MNRVLRRVATITIAALIGTAAVAVTTQPASAATPTDDIIFSLDGSGSIDAADWQLQKDGYSAALQDAVAFPRDGSVAVGVSQWASSGQVQQEVALRVINAQADVDAVVAAIQAISQFQGSTDPVTGLNFATSQLTGSGRVGTNWTICMSSDGVQNSGGGSITGSATAAAAAGVDKFSVVGIEDFGNGASLRAYYGGAVFGGGTFSLARNTVEFANLIIGGCRNEPVEVVALEVNQGIQNWTNTVGMVAGKATAVRAFVQVPAGVDPQRVSGRLIGRRGGAELPGSPLLATNSGGSVLADTNIVARRGLLNDSLNFVLPSSWRTGTVELELDGAGTALTCKDAALPTVDDCKVTVTFAAGADAKLKVVAIPVRTGTTTTTPSTAALRETGERIRTTLPASRLGVSTGTLYSTFTGAPSLATVNSRLGTQRFLDLCFGFLGCDTLYYGQLSGNAGGGLAAGLPSDVSSGYDFGVTTRGAPGFFRNVAPHEVGHSLGLPHSVTATTATVSGTTYQSGPCGEFAEIPAPVYPYFGAVGGVQRSLLNPAAAGDNTQNWGLDNRFVRGDVANLAVVAPIGARATFDLMGYCWVASPQDTWPSDYTWNLLKSGLDSRFGATVTARVAAAAVGTTTGDHLVFSGVVSRDGSTATINPPARVTGELPVPDAGSYTLRLLDAGGAELAAVAFGVDFDGGRPGAPSAPAESASFVVPVLVPATAVAKVEIVTDGTVIGQVTASAAAPVVTVTAPTAGATFAGATVDLAWTGNDADGDDLTYTVRYSPDGGTTWETLAVDFDGTTLSVPRTDLTGGANAVIEVQASDGLNVTTARSAAFSVVGAGPVVTITSPLDGEVFYSGVQQVILEGLAEDNEDGDVSSSLAWSSDRDGSVFTGPSGSVGADTLSEGTHVLTATAVDSAGNTGTAQVTIEVFRVAPPPPADEAPVVTITSPANGSSFGPTPSDIDLAATAADAEDGDVSSSITWSSDRVGALVTGPTGTVRSDSLAPGVHVLTASATDSTGQTGSASVSITVVVPIVSSGLLVSLSPDRSSPVALDGTDQTGRTIYVFVQGTDIRRVVFRLDNESSRTEATAPWDLQGTAGNRLAKGLDTRRLRDGRHAVTAVITKTDGSTQTVTGLFLVGAPVPTEPGLLVSGESDRSPATALDGAVVSNPASYVFVDAPGATQVRFLVDGREVKVERSAPFDLAGTASGSARPALPYDFTKLSDGQHTVTAVVSFPGGRRTTVVATITVA